MPGTDNRDMLSGIGTKIPASGKLGKMGGKKVAHVQRTWTKDDNFDEIQCHLTPDEVDRLCEPDPATGLPVLVGDWEGKATRGPNKKDPDTGEEIPNSGEVIPAEFEHPERHPKARKKKKAE